MTLPLLSYKTSSQNQRVAGYEVPSEDTPRVYRRADCSTESEFQALLWAAYRQVFSEHVILSAYRSVVLETQLRNRAISVRDFIRGLVKTDVYRRLVVDTNSNYRVVELTLKRLLGRAPYDPTELMAWSTQIATVGFEAFVDALVDGEEYRNNFGDHVVPYQRRRYKDRPFNLVTPRYDSYWRDKLESERYRWGAVSNFLDMARELKPQGRVPLTVTTANLTIPNCETAAKGVPVSINPTPSFPLG